ncbi:MAG: serine hydrolase domain-containing protein [Anderseniella sp.]
MQSIMRQAGYVICSLAAGLLIVMYPALAKDSRMEQDLDKAFAAGQLSGLHSVLVIHKGTVLAERHYAGDDQRWGTPLATIEHNKNSLHDLRSVTKSVTGLLYGIALSEGIVPGLDDGLIQQFPEYADLANDPQRIRIRVRHALSMKMGTEWNEDLPYSDPRNSEIAMERAKDRYRFVLDRPMVNKPGDWWTYNGGATALIGKLIAQGAGLPIDAYARNKLFAPLAIKEFESVAGADGVPSAASGLRLSIHDLAKMGRLILDNGVWQGKQVVPAEWLQVSFTPHAVLRDGLRYGFFWWLGPDGTPPYWVAGFGNGGQRLMVSPANRLIVVVFAGNYNQPDAWKLPVKIITKFALPAVSRSE